jgi:hypothetical protein
MSPSNPGCLAALPLAPDETGVPLKIDGSSFVAGLRLCDTEHARRRDLGVGSATSTGLLHALWGLPYGIPVPWASMSERDRITLDGEGFGWIDDAGGAVVRTYQPPGAVGTIVVADSSLPRAVSRAASHPPTVRRVVLWRRQSDRPPRRQPAQLERASSFGIGIFAVNEGECREVLPAAPALTGLPAVFRWWQAELAYRNWLMHIEPTGATALSA